MLEEKRQVPAMKMLIVDDHTLFREGMLHVFARLDELVEVLQAATCGQALEMVSAHPDLNLVLMDIELPDGSGLEGLSVLSRQYPLLPVVMLSASQDRAHMKQALDQGATGFIPKTATAAVMLNALRLVLAGGVYVPPEMLAAAPPEKDAIGSQTVSDTRLTPRQIEVLHMIVEGSPNKRIAARLALSEATVKAHVSAIMRALNVTNRTQAVHAARMMGLVSGES